MVREKVEELSDARRRELTSFMSEVQIAVLLERQYQNEKWGIQRHDNGKWLGILGEENGEVCQAVNGLHFPQDAKETDADNLYNELIQVAAVSQAWAEQLLEEKRGRQLCQSQK